MKLWRFVSLFWRRQLFEIEGWFSSPFWRLWIWFLLPVFPQPPFCWGLWRLAGFVQLPVLLQVFGFAKSEFSLEHAEALVLQEFAEFALSERFVLLARMPVFFEALQGSGGSKRGAVVCSWGILLWACLHPLLLIC